MKEGKGLILIVLFLALLSCKNNQPYLNLDTTYVYADSLIQYRETFLFSDYAFYHKGKVYACEFKRGGWETRNFRYEMRGDKLERTFRLDNDFKNRSYLVATYLVER